MFETDDGHREQRRRRIVVSARKFYFTDSCIKFLDHYPQNNHDAATAPYDACPLVGLLSPKGARYLSDHRGDGSEVPEHLGLRDDIPHHRTSCGLSSSASCFSSIFHLHCNSKPKRPIPFTDHRHRGLYSKHHHTSDHSRRWAFLPSRNRC